MISPDEEILICAVRYALGRMSYIVGDVARYVELKQEELSEQCKKIIIDDIERELTLYNDMGQTLGMECDERTWRNLLQLLKEGVICG